MQGSGRSLANWNLTRGAGRGQINENDQLTDELPMLSSFTRNYLRTIAPIVTAVLAVAFTACVHNAPVQESEDNVEISDKAAQREKKSAGKKPKTSADIITEVTGDTRIDPLPALGDGTDDFGDLDKRAEEYRKAALVESEDARIERELREIRDTEAKAKQIAEKIEAEQRADANKKAREEAAANAKTNRKIQRAAEEKAKSLQGIESDELEWNGLN